MLKILYISYKSVQLLLFKHYTMILNISYNNVIPLSDTISLYIETIYMYNVFEVQIFVILCKYMK